MSPTATEIGQMVRLPTRAAGLRFEEDPSSNERLDDMLRDAAAARPELLPLLQFTLQELYERRRDDGDDLTHLHAPGCAAEHVAHFQVLHHVARDAAAAADDAGHAEDRSPCHHAAGRGRDTQLGHKAR